MSDQKNVAKREDGFEGQYFIKLSEAMLLRFSAHTVAKMLYPLTFGFFPVAHGHRVRSHEGKRGHSLVYCMHGEGRFEMAGRTYDIKTGDVFYTPPWTAHLYEASDTHPWSTLWVRFNGELAETYCAMLGLSVDKPVLRTSRQKTVFNCHQELLAARKVYYTEAALIELSHRLTGFVIALMASIEHTPEDKSTVKDRVLETIDYMKRNIHRSCSLDEFVRQSNLSRAQYCRIFHAVTGLTPMTQFLQMKIDDAINKLLCTNMNVEEIARSLGYSDPLYFSRVFKKAQGKSPTLYRQTNSERRQAHIT